MLKKFFTLTGLVWFLSGCATHAYLPQTTADLPQLSSSEPVYVRVPEDGEYYQGRPYAGSGRMVASAIRESLFAYTTQVTVGASAESRTAAIKSASQVKATYLFFPDIKHWEDRATEWSGKADRLEASIEVIDVATGKQIHGATLTGKSSWFTLGGDHPQDMLKAPVSEYIDALYGR